MVLQTVKCICKNHHNVFLQSISNFITAFAYTNTFNILVNQQQKYNININVNRGDLLKSNSLHVKYSIFYYISIIYEIQFKH